jgi:hypothetical protein
MQQQAMVRPPPPPHGLPPPVHHKMPPPPPPKIAPPVVVRPVPTLYLKNLNEKIKPEGKSGGPLTPPPSDFRVENHSLSLALCAWGPC